MHALGLLDAGEEKCGGTTFPRKTSLFTSRHDVRPRRPEPSMNVSVKVLTLLSVP